MQFTHHWRKEVTNCFRLGNIKRFRCFLARSSKKSGLRVCFDLVHLLMNFSRLGRPWVMSWTSQRNMFEFYLVFLLFYWKKVLWMKRATSCSRENLEVPVVAHVQPSCQQERSIAHWLFICNAEKHMMCAVCSVYLVVPSKRGGCSEVETRIGGIASLAELHAHLVSSSGSGTRKTAIAAGI